MNIHIRGKQYRIFDKSANSSHYDNFDGPEDPSFNTAVPMSYRTAQAGGHMHGGTACCIDIDVNNNTTTNTNHRTKTAKKNDDTDNYSDRRPKYLKVGIGHTVTRERSYLSFFYAFEPEPPFRIHSRSGYFCLGAMKCTDKGYSNHWVSNNQFEFSSQLRVQKKTYNCPKITFPTGIAEMVGEKDQVIISYGVNDCYSRSIIVPTGKIKMLFGF